MPISNELRALLTRDPSVVLGPTDLRKLDAEFRKFDKDGDGEITRVELQRELADKQAAPFNPNAVAARRAGSAGALTGRSDLDLRFMADAQIDAILAEVDLDGDGLLTFEELASATAVRHVEALLDKIAREITILDPAGDVSERAINEAILDRLLEAIGLYDAPTRAKVLAGIERGADGRVYPERLAVAFFAAKRS